MFFAGWNCAGDWHKTALQTGVGHEIAKFGTWKRMQRSENIRDCFELHVRDRREGQTHAQCIYSPFQTQPLKKGCIKQRACSKIGISAVIFSHSFSATFAAVTWRRNLGYQAICSTHLWRGKNYQAISFSRFTKQSIRRASSVIVDVHWKVHKLRISNALRQTLDTSSN